MSGYGNRCDDTDDHTFGSLQIQAGSDMEPGDKFIFEYPEEF